MNLCGQKMNLRALEPEDLEFLFEIENNESFWEVSHTQVPFSKYILKQYLENAHLDIFETKQLRLLIEEKNTKKRMGMVDLFDFNPQHLEELESEFWYILNFKIKELPLVALEMIIRYAFSQLNLHQLYANILPKTTNKVSHYSKRIILYL